MVPNMREATSSSQPVLEVYYCKDKFINGGPFDGSSPQAIPLPLKAVPAYIFHITSELEKFLNSKQYKAPNDGTGLIHC